MPLPDKSTTIEEKEQAAKSKRWWLIVPLVLLGLLIVAIAILWSQRTIIADRYIQDYLDDMDVAARYEIVDLSTKKQHLRNIVIGNVDNPDVQIDELIVFTTPQFSGIAIDEVRVKGVRLYGDLRDNRVSFGVLDKFIYTDSDEPFALPDLNVTLNDVHAKITTPYGDIGASARGAGHLLDGFEGNVGFIAKQIDYADCKLDRPSAYFSISINALQPLITGPVRLANLDCASRNIAAATSALQTQIVIGRSLDSASYSLIGDAQRLLYTLGNADKISSERLDIAIKGDVDSTALEGNIDLAASALSSPWGRIEDSKISVTALDPISFESLNDIKNLSLGYQLRADNIALDDGYKAALAQSDAAFAGTPFAALWQKALPTFRRSVASLRLAASGRIDDGVAVAENITVREGNNRLIARISNVRYKIEKNGLSGLESLDFEALHPQLPQLSAAWDNQRNRRQLSLKMPKYSANGSSLALEPTQMRFAEDGFERVIIEGAMRLTGPVPGGRLDNAQIPVSGTVRNGNSYFVKNGRCQSIAFDGLSLSALRMGKETFLLCPKNGQALLAYGNNGLAINARSQKIELSSMLGETPFYFASDGLDISYPAATELDNVAIRIGEGDTITSIKAGRIGLAGGADIIGDFEEAEAFISNVPLLLSDGSGRWGFANSVLTLNSDDWIVSDRAKAPRFNPLQGRVISLTLQDNMINANGDLYAPSQPAKIASVDIVHDLSSGTGGADLFVPGIRFTENLQPDMLTDLTIGIIALAEGEVAGQGRINWNSQGVESTGKFGTDGLDFAAAFGPVKGLKGDIIFSDLLALETPPGQRVTIDEVNPGIAAFDGVVRYQLLANQRVILEDARWPFSGGDLSLEPTTFNLAIEEERALNFEMKGLDAAAFLTRFDFENLSATGNFDGRLPMRFNRAGGRIEGGRLSVGPDGGTLSYVGELTYEDLSAYGNFAFQSLRDIRYRSLEIEMNGPLDGELVTRVRFDGLSQGESASRNFITKQIAKLPIRFNINIRAPFFQLITSTRSLYDSSFVLDPVAAGVISPKSKIDPPEDRQDNQPE